MQNINPIQRTLLNAATTTGDSEIINIIERSNLAAIISGTSTSFTVKFYVSNNKTTWGLIKGYSTDEDTVASGSSVTATGVGLEFDITNWNYFKASVTAISGNNVTVDANIL